MTTLRDAILAYLSNVKKSRGANTFLTYQTVLLGAKSGFLWRVKGITDKDPVSSLTEKQAMQYMQDILDLSPATRQLHATVIRRFYTFVAGNDWAVVSVDRLNFLFEGSNVLSPVKRAIEFDKEHIRAFLEAIYAWNCADTAKIKRLLNRRDKAFIITLAHSGLRVHEACKLRIKDLDMETGTGVIVGKGRKQARFKVSPKAVEAIRAYLGRRDRLVPIEPNQPVFSRHDRRSRGKIIHMLPKSGEQIVHRVEKALTGKDTLSCHAFRHYFVTLVLEKTKNLKAAQVLARHTNIDVTARYAHLMTEEADAEFAAAMN